MFRVAAARRIELGFQAMGKEPLRRDETVLVLCVIDFELEARAASIIDVEPTESFTVLVSLAMSSYPVRYRLADEGIAWGRAGTLPGELLAAYRLRAPTPSNGAQGAGTTPPRVLPVWV
jgi:hypothetical protein